MASETGHHCWGFRLATRRLGDAASDARAGMAGVASVGEDAEPERGAPSKGAAIGRFTTWTMCGGRRNQVRRPSIITGIQAGLADAHAPWPLPGTPWSAWSCARPGMQCMASKERTARREHEDGFCCALHPSPRFGEGGRVGTAVCRPAAPARPLEPNGWARNGG